MATAKVTARFKSSGVPSTGLSPTVTILNRSLGTEEVSDAAMTEVSDGFYEYSFTTFNVRYDYLFAFDGTATLSDSDRYLSAEWSGMEEWLSQIPSGGGGGTIQEVNMTTHQYEELRDRLIAMMEGVEIDISTGSIEEDVKKAIKELKDKAKEQLEKVSKKIVADHKKLAEKVKKPTVNIETQSVDLSGLEDMKEKLEESTKFMDNLLGDFARFVQEGINDLKGMETKSLKQAQADFLKQQLKKLEE